MADLSTAFLGFDAGADYVLGALGLAEDDGLETAVLLSLFTDRRAEADDALPGSDVDRRGWWGDAWPDIPGDRIGSRLWLLHREKQTPAVLGRAQQYAREALAWMIDDGIASGVDVVATIPRGGVLALEIGITRPANPPIRYRFERFWSGDAV
jgi:phage gp46-like protein